MAFDAAKDKATAVTIKAPRMDVAKFTIIGTAPLMIARFSKKAEIMAKHQEGGGAKNKRARSARDFDAEGEDAAYRNSPDGWYGMNAAGFRNAMISACRLVGFKMTLAKLSVFIKADGHDYRDFTPLLQIEGPHTISTMHTRNATGVIDIRARPVWAPGWKLRPTIQWDADQFTASDIANLLMRVGMQVGLCEGRPDSKSSAGLGYGLFEIQEHDDEPQPKTKKR